MHFFNAFLSSLPSPRQGGSNAVQETRFGARRRSADLPHTVFLLSMAMSEDQYFVTLCIFHAL